MIDLSKLKGLSDWQKMRGEIEAAVISAMGPLSKTRAELQVKVLDEFSYDGYVRRRVNYFVDDWERVSAWQFIPEGKEEVPAILCCHQMAPQAKNEAAGLGGDLRLAFAKYYAELGYATIAPDVLTAGDRVSVGLEPYDTKAYYKEKPKASIMGRILWDHVHALDALCETRRVDPERLGVIGHGLGAVNALLLAGFDERIQACVASCGFTRFADDDNPKRWACEEGFTYFPQLKSALESRDFPFDWEHILALAAPSPTLLLTALNDESFPKTKNCEKAVKLARKVYKLLGEESAIENCAHNDGHCVTVDGQERASDWFERWL